jgi:hypothetical protein
LVELTNNPFDDVEIREFGAVAMKTGCRPPNTLPRTATAKRTWWSFVPSVIADQLWRRRILRMRIPTRRALAINGREQ